MATGKRFLDKYFSPYTTVFLNLVKLQTCNLQTGSKTNSKKKEYFYSRFKQNMPLVNQKICFQHEQAEAQYIYICNTPSPALSQISPIANYTHQNSYSNVSYRDQNLSNLILTQAFNRTGLQYTLHCSYYAIHILDKCNKLSSNMDFFSLNTGITFHT